MYGRVVRGEALSVVAPSDSEFVRLLRRLDVNQRVNVTDCEDYRLPERSGVDDPLWVLCDEFHPPHWLGRWLA